MIQGILISAISTGIYMVFTSGVSHPDPYQAHLNEQKRRRECLGVSAIVFGVTVFLLVMTSSSQAMTVGTSTTTTPLTCKPPF